MLYSKLPEFRAISVALLSIFPQLSVDYYEGDEYYGRLIELFADDSLVAAAAAGLLQRLLLSRTGPCLDSQFTSFRLCNKSENELLNLLRLTYPITTHYPTTPLAPSASSKQGN